MEVTVSTLGSKPVNKMSLQANNPISSSSSSHHHKLGSGDVSKLWGITHLSMGIYSCKVKGWSWITRFIPSSSQDCSVVKELVSRLCMQKAHRNGDCREIRKQSPLCRLLRTPLALSHPIYCGGGRDGLG